MACATLKRSIDFDLLHSPGSSPKRRRCSPLLTPSRSAISTPSPKSCSQPSPFLPVSPSLSPGQLAANICLEWKRLKRRKRLVESDPNDSPSSSSSSSPHHHDLSSHHHHQHPHHQYAASAMVQQHMTGISPSPLFPSSSSHLALNQFSHHQHHHQQPLSQHHSLGGGNSSPLSLPLPASMATGQSSPSSPSSSRSKDQPMFTLRQVIMICERMLKDQDSRIREEYDKVLGCKLAEQYDSFVKFNQDQLQRRFRDTTASYVS